MERVIGWMAVALAAVGCGRPALSSPTSNPKVPLKVMYGADSIRFVGYEYYGWRNSQRFSTHPFAAIPAAMGAPEQLFEMDGCRVGGYEYYGYQPFVTCDETRRGAQPSGPSKLTRPVEILFEHDGCLVYRFEYYGWRYFARCGVSGQPHPPSKLTQPVRFLFADQACRAFTFEYYGWHSVVHCDDSVRPDRPDPPSALTRPIEVIFEADGCRTSRFEYYGWYHFTRCSAGFPTTFTGNSESYTCGQSTCSREYEVQVTTTPGPVRW